MTLGQTIKNARKKKGWTQERLGKEVGLGQATISALEHDDLGARLDAPTLIRVAEALGETSILVHHCETCPIRLHLFEKRYGELKEKRQDLAAVAMQLREEMGAAVTSAADFGSNTQKRENARSLFSRSVTSSVESGFSGSR